MNRHYYRRHCDAELAKGFWNPAFSLWRAYEAEAISAVQLEEPVLDLGCGDGTFSQLVLKSTQTLGIDLDFDVLKQAVRLDNYSLTIQADSIKLPFHNASFGSVISNSALEHMHQLGDVFSEVRRVLRPGGLFAFTVPSHLYGEYLFTSRLLRWMGQPQLAETYARRKNKRAQHLNLHSPEEWRHLLELSSFRLLRFEYILPELSMWLWEWPHTSFSALQPAIHRILSTWMGKRLLVAPISVVSNVTFGQAYRVLRNAASGGNLFFLAQRAR
jgi:SAM-dependent methyltransferase